MDPSPAALFLRPSTALRSAVDASGPPGPALRALILIGLLQSGADPAALEAEYYEAVGGRGLAPRVRQALEQAWMLAPCKQPASTTDRPALRLIERAEPAPTTPDLWAFGVEV